MALRLSEGLGPTEATTVMLDCAHARPEAAANEPKSAITEHTAPVTSRPTKLAPAGVYT